VTQFEHARYKPPTPLSRPRELVVACEPMRSNVNLSNIARTASCCGAAKLIATGSGKLVRDVARDAAETLPLEVRRSLAPVLRALKAEGFTLVGLEQTSGSTSLHQYAFDRKTVLVVGNERMGISEEILALVDAAVEIPVWGLPYSYNAATATAMALYEYCRQYPSG
jgi:tRNA G18 (ribose-2'-O)-methylase SpoU